MEHEPDSSIEMIIRQLLPPEYLKAAYSEALVDLIHDEYDLTSRISSPEGRELSEDEKIRYAVEAAERILTRRNGLIAAYQDAVPSTSLEDFGFRVMSSETRPKLTKILKEKKPDILMIREGTELPFELRGQNVPAVVEYRDQELLVPLSIVTLCRRLDENFRERIRLSQPAKGITRADVLLIDLNEKSAGAAGEYLNNRRFGVMRAKTVTEALEMLLDREFSSILINPIQPVVEMDNLIAGLKTPMYSFCSGIPIVTACPAGNEEARAILIRKGKDHNEGGVFFHVPTPYSEDVLESAMQNVMTHRAEIEQGRKKEGGSGEEKRKSGMLRSLASLVPGKADTDEKLTQILEDPISMATIAFQRLYSGDVESAELLLDVLFSKQGKNLTTVFQAGDTNSTNAFFTPEDGMPGQVAAWVIKKYGHELGAPVEFHAYRRLHTRNRDIIRGMRIAGSHKDIPLQTDEDLGIVSEGMTLREARGYSMLPIVNLVRLLPDVTSGRFMSRYLIMEKIGPIEKIEEEKSLTYYNLLPYIDEMPSEDFQREFRKQMEFKRNEFLAYVQHGGSALKPGSLLVPAHLSRKRTETNLGYDFAVNTRRIAISLGIIFDHETFGYFWGSASFLNSMLIQRAFTSARDTTGRNTMFKPRASAGGATEFNFDGLQALAEKLHESYMRGGQKVLRNRLDWTVHEIDFDKILRWTHEFEDSRNDVSLRINLSEEDRIMLDYHSLLQRARFAAIGAYRAGHVPYSEVRRITDRIKDIELGRVTPGEKKKIGRIEEAIFGKGFVPYASIESCESDLEIVAIHRNARTARHILVEYVPKDKSSINDAKKHFNEVMRQLELQIGRIRSKNPSPEEPYTKLYAPFKGDPIEGIKMYGRMFTELEEKGLAELSNAAKMRVVECTYRSFIERAG